MKICKECKKDEGNVEFYLRYKTICKKCHYKKQKAARRENI